MRFISVVAASLLGSLLAILAVFFLMMFFVFVMAASSSSTPAVRTGSTLVVKLSGSVPETASGDPLAQSLLGEAAYGLHDLTRAIGAAATDKRIDALWIKTGLLSMSWASLQAVRRAVQEFRASEKPVYASSSSYYMTEKEYFVASAADSVFLDPSSFFEMNGFVLSTPHFKGLLDKLHVEPLVVRAGSFKSAVEPFTRTDMSAANREQLSALLDDINHVFVSEIAASRNLDAAAIESRIESDAIMAATEALDAGFLDGLFFEDQVREIIATRIGQDDPEKLREITVRNYFRSAPRKFSGSNEIAVVNAVGTMIAGGSSDIPNPIFGGPTLGSESFVKSLRRARKNKRTRAVVIRINSPGGQASAADAMLREIKLTAEKMPVVVSMGDVAASGGYWITTGSSTVVAEPLTITGSIGVFSLFFDVSGLLEDHLGVTYDQVQTSPFADMFSGMRPFSENEVRLFEDITDNIYDTFVSNIAESRELTKEQVIDLAGGRIWTGAAAKERGLVDELGGLDHAIEIASQQAELSDGDFRVRTYPTPRSFWQRMTSQTKVLMARLGILSAASQLDQRVMDTSRYLSAFLDAHGHVQARMPFRVEVN